MCFDSEFVCWLNNFQNPLNLNYILKVYNLLSSLATLFIGHNNMVAYVYFLLLIFMLFREVLIQAFN